MSLRRVWRYQRGNQNPYIEEEQTTQCPKEKMQKDKQRSIKHTYKTIKYLHLYWCEVPDEVYFRNVSCTLKSISTFVLMWGT